MESVSSASAVSLTIKVRGVNCRGKMISMCRSQEGRLLRAQVRKMLALQAREPEFDPSDAHGGER